MQYISTQTCIYPLFLVHFLEPIIKCCDHDEFCRREQCLKLEEVRLVSWCSLTLWPNVPSPTCQGTLATTGLGLLSTLLSLSVLEPFIWMWGQATTLFWYFYISFESNLKLSLYHSFARNLTFLEFMCFLPFIAGQRFLCIFCFWFCDLHVNWWIPFICWRHEGECSVPPMQQLTIILTIM